jgi:hypothetical protein
LTSTEASSLVAGSTSGGIGGANLFAGTYGSGVWRRTLSEMITAVKETESEIPARFSLSQNYPNPFNPATTITYMVPKSVHVKLIVYDLLGREISRLINEEKQEGSYSVFFDASQLPSGLYLCRLTAGEYTMVKKMLLLK